MLNLRKRIPLYLFIFLLLISSIYLIQHPSIISNLFLIDSRATQQAISMSVTITGSSEENTTVPATGIVEPTDTTIKQTLQKITGLDEGYEVRMRVYTNQSTPEGFTAPTSTEVDQVFKYINITLNYTFTGTATIFFNVTQSNLAGTDPDDIALFKYTTSWNELPTIVLDSTQDPVPFSATTTSFSGFLIGAKAAAGPAAPVGGGAASKGAFVYVGEKPEEPPKRPVVKLPEVVKKVIKKIAELPKQLLRYKISYKIIYIIAIALLSLVIILEITYYFISKKK